MKFVCFERRSIKLDSKSSQAQLKLSINFNFASKSNFGSVVMTNLGLKMSIISSAHEKILRQFHVLVTFLPIICHVNHKKL